LPRLEPRLDAAGPIDGRIGLAKGRGAGGGERAPIAQRGQDGVCLGIEALKEEEIVLSMDRDENALRTRQPRPGAGTGRGHRGKRITRLGAERGVTVFEREGEFIHRVGAFHDCEIRLQRHAQLGAGIQDIILREDGERRPVECHHLRPLETRHVVDQRGARGREDGLIQNELRQPAAEIAQGKRGRGILREKGRGQLHEAPAAEDRAHAGIIVVQTIQHAKPIRFRVNLQPLHGTQPACRLHEIRRNTGRRATLLPPGLQPATGGERAEERLAHHALELAQIADGIDPRRQQARPWRLSCFRRGTDWL
jgi:hypothetical protein